MRSFYTFLTCLFLLLISCDKEKKDKNVNALISDESTDNISILEKVDHLNSDIQKSVSDFDWKISLDHHRMAEKEGAYTPPAVASVFSDHQINTNLLDNTHQLLGLDLPYKVLCYAEADTIRANLAYTSAEFIVRRHGLSPDLFEEYSKKLKLVLNSVEGATISSTNLDSVSKGFGIIKIKSDYDYTTTVKNVTDIVLTQSDTQWFGEIDYSKEAGTRGKEMHPTILLLFGGPAPGAMAMKTTPKIGLDAFCQKLLVFENNDKEVWIAFNDIVAFSNLYYGQVTKPQQGINQRLIQTFTKAVRKP